MNRKTLRRIFAGGLLLGAVAVWLYSMWVREPTYKDESLSNWLEKEIVVHPTQRPNLGDHDIHLSAIYHPHTASAIEQMGEDAVPYLLPQLRDENGNRPITKTVQSLLFPGTGIKRQDQERAMGAMIALGTNSTPALIELMNHPPDREVAISIASSLSIVHLGKSRDARLVPSLIKCLEDINWTVRANAASTLARYGEAAAPAVPHFIVMLGGEDPSLRMSAAQALGKLGATAEAAIPALVERCRIETNRDTRFRAAEALLKLNGHHPLAEEILIECLAEASRYVSHHKDAARALANLSPLTEKSRSALEDAAMERSTPLGEFAKGLLKEIEHQPAPAPKPN